MIVPANNRMPSGSRSRSALQGLVLIGSSRRSHSRLSSSASTVIGTLTQMI